MRRFLILIPVFILLIASCNFPLFHSAETSSLIATKVAETLTATGSAPGTNSTIIVVTQTPNSSLPTATQGLTSTPTPTDPKTTLGTPVYADSFTSGSAFGLKAPYTDDAVTMSVENGNLVMETSHAYSGYRWRLTYLTPKDYYVEGAFKTVNCSGNDYYGLVLRAPNYTDGRGYYFGISCGGEYYFARNDGGDDIVLSDWTSDPNIVAGSGQENRLGVMLKDKHFSLYLNGKLVKELEDDGIDAKGYFGVFIYSVEQSNMTIDVEEIDQWNLP